MAIQKTFDKAPEGLPNLNIIEPFRKAVVENEIASLENKNRRESLQGTCFSEDTHVHTEYGLAEIRYIVPGDLVLSRSEVTGEQGYRRVTKVFEYDYTKVYMIFFRSDLGVEDVTFVTAEHPFWVNGFGWIEASCLQPGQIVEIIDPEGLGDIEARPKGQLQELALSGKRQQATVVKVEVAKYEAAVYNLEVEEFNTYFVGFFGIWVHNCNESGKPVDYWHPPSKR